MANPMYGVPGLANLLGDKLKDPKQLPLIVSVDAFINETTALSDYIVPDTVTDESWGMTSPWHGVPTKTVTARWPIVNAFWNEKVGTSRNTMTGEYYSGCPTWYPQKLADGTPLEEKYPVSEWPLP